MSKPDSKQLLTILNMASRNQNPQDTVRDQALDELTEAVNKLIDTAQEEDEHKQEVEKVQREPLENIKITKRKSAFTRYDQEREHERCVGDFLFRCQKTAEWMSWSTAEREVVLRALTAARIQGSGGNYTYTLRERFHAVWNVATQRMRESTQTLRDNGKVLYVNLIVDMLILLFGFSEDGHSSVDVENTECDDFWRKRLVHLLQAINAVANPGLPPRSLNVCISSEDIYPDTQDALPPMDISSAVTEYQEYNPPSDR